MTQRPCLQCGACCRTLIIEVDDLDALREPRIAECCPPLKGLDEEDPDGEMGFMLACGAFQPCPFMESGRYCSIYPTRPNACVGFPPGEAQCNEAREAAGWPPYAEAAKGSGR